MATVPIAQPAESVEQRFRRLAAVWRRETAHLSSPTKMFAHPAYQEIIGLGRDAVPLLLRELELNPDHWFGALRALTGASPVAEEDRGDVEKMAAGWQRWGRENGYR